MADAPRVGKAGRGRLSNAAHHRERGDPGFFGRVRRLQGLGRQVLSTNNAWAMELFWRRASG